MSLHRNGSGTKLRSRWTSTPDPSYNTKVAGFITQKLIAVAYGLLAKLKVIKDANLDAPGYKLITIWSHEAAFLFIVMQLLLLPWKMMSLERDCSSL